MELKIKIKSGEVNKILESNKKGKKAAVEKIVNKLYGMFHYHIRYYQHITSSYCIILYYIILYCIILYYIIL